MRLVKSLSAYPTLFTIQDKEEARMAGWRGGNSVYVAGQLALDKDGNLVGPNDIRAQSRRVLENMRRVLETAGRWDRIDRPSLAD